MHLLKQSPKKGFRLLRKLELTYPHNADIYYNLGVALLYQDKLEEAEKYFKKTLKLKADCQQAKDNLKFTVRIKEIFGKQCTEEDLEEMGTLLSSATDTGFFDLAIRIGNLMVSVDKGPGSLNDLGLTFYHKQEFDNALQCYNKALEIDPNMHEAISNKAFCLMVKNRLAEAYTLYKRVVELSPDFLQGWYHLGYLSLCKKNYVEALSYLDKAIELNDEYYLAWFAKYQALMQLKRTEEADKCLEKAVYLNPEYAAQLAEGNWDKIPIQTTNMHAKTRREV